MSTVRDPHNVYNAHYNCLCRHTDDVTPAVNEMDQVHADLVAIMAALGIKDYARPYSSHEVVHREIIPAITALNRRPA